MDPTSAVAKGGGAGGRTPTTATSAPLLVY